MKKKIFYILPLAFTMVGFSSCLDFDNPGDELQVNQSVVDDQTYHGSPLSIKADVYAKTKETFDKANTNLSTVISQMNGGQYALRGGKEASYPGSHAYQRQFCLGPDNYAQYSTVPHHDFMYGELTSTYYLSMDFNGGTNSSYIIAKNYMTPLLNHPDVDSIPELKAITLLMHDLAAQEVTDVYGPFPYDEYLTNKTESPFKYNSIKEIYQAIYGNINAEIKCFQAFDSKPDWYKKKVQTLIYKYGKLTNDEENGIEGFETWIRFANSLKMRMAMHMNKVAPSMAEKWFQEALAGGVVDDEKYEIGFRPMTIGFTHPLCEISHTWGDTRLSASFCTLLKSLNHPFLGYLFGKNSNMLHNKATGAVMAAKSDYVGIREGAHVGVGQSYANNEYIGFSEIENSSEFVQLAPLYVFKTSELYFLRAEGALRGWSNEDPEGLYYKGIKEGDFADRIMKEDTPYASAMKGYMTQTEPVAGVVWKDPMGQEEDMPSVTKIGVVWGKLGNVDKSSDREYLLEQIITQKYISLWPCSFEAWVDLRRTGYPKLFPVLNTSDSDGSLKAGDLIRRMPWVPTDDATKADVQNSGISALGGPDLQGTRLWWDVAGKGNF